MMNEFNTIETIPNVRLWQLDNEDSPADDGDDASQNVRCMCTDEKIEKSYRQYVKYLKNKRGTPMSERIAQTHVPKEVFFRDLQEKLKFETEENEEKKKNFYKIVTDVFLPYFDGSNFYFAYNVLDPFQLSVIIELFPYFFHETVTTEKKENVENAEPNESLLNYFQIFNKYVWDRQFELKEITARVLLFSLETVCKHLDLKTACACLVFVRDNLDDILSYNQNPVVEKFRHCINLTIAKYDCPQKREIVNLNEL